MKFVKICENLICAESAVSKGKWSLESKMDCEKCLAQLDDYLSGNLDLTDCAAVKEHLENCLPCVSFSSDLSAILEGCGETREFQEAPPNAQALWLRISNIVECEQSVLAVVECKKTSYAAPKNSWWTRNWQLSTHQMASAVLGIAVITSLLTVVGLKNFSSFRANSAVKTDSIASFLSGSQPAGRNLESENRFRQQELAIDYWNRRVEARRGQWNQGLRSAFDRNLREINSVVADYQKQLQTNPEDKISAEMLDSALNDKTELLREFSEL